MPQNQQGTSEPEISMIGVIQNNKIISTSARYEALTSEHISAILECNFCQENFEFISEFIAHLGLRPTCRKSIRTGFAPTEKLSDVLVTYIKNLGGQTEEEYSCAQCNATPSSVLSYLLHRDSHICGRKFICPICTGIFNAPYDFFRHGCTSLKVCEKLDQTDQTCTAIYPSIDPSAVVAMLKCPMCPRKFDTASQFESHLSFSKVCSMKLTKFRKKNSKVVHLDLYFQEHFGIKKELVTCDLCTEVLKSKCAYMLHMDHHRSAKYSATCKKCRQTFKSFCSFNRHKCENGRKINWCYFCEKLNSLPDKPPPSKQNTNQENVSGQDMVIKMEVEIDSDSAATLKSSDSTTSSDTKNSEPSQPKRKIPDSGKESGLDIDLADSYICRDCGNKLLLNSDALYDHCEKLKGACDIVPLCAYNGFKVKVRDIATSKLYGPLVAKLCQPLERSRKRKAQSEGENQPQMKMPDRLQGDGDADVPAPSE